MLEFFGFWLVEELLPDGELVVDFFLAEAEVGDVEESYARASACVCVCAALARGPGGMGDGICTYQFGALHLSIVRRAFVFLLECRIGINPMRQGLHSPLSRRQHKRTPRSSIDGS